MTILQKLDRIPPFYCRLIARARRRPITNAEIAERTGLTQTRLTRIFKQPSWADVPVRYVDSVMQACGIEPGKHWMHVHYLKRSMLAIRGGTALQPFRHINGIPADERRRILRWGRNRLDRTREPAYRPVQ